MDLLRSTIKSLLYDFPIEAVVEHLANRESASFRGEGESPFEGRKFYDLAAELMSWREKGFSTTETGLLNEVLREVWLVDEENSFPLEPVYHPYERLILLLEKCGRELLETALDKPLVRFEHLLRWRELTLLIGEDTVILPVIARKDVSMNIERHTFLWPNTIDHNEIRLNAILDETLSDTHFHLNAGCDVFEFNWLTVMNNPDVINKIRGDFLVTGSRREYDRVRRHSELNLNLREWIILACELRLKLYEALLEDNADVMLDIDFNQLYNGKRPSAINLMVLLDKYRQLGKKTSNNLVFDYAITNKNTVDLSDAELSNVYMVHHGERFLLYTFMKKYYGGGNDKWRRCASIIYLYILIKNKVRRELIQTNTLRGFENFQIYQQYKDVFFKRENIKSEVNDTERKRMQIVEERNQKIREIAYRYAVQSALGEKRMHYLEARVAPGAIKQHQEMDFGISIYGNCTVLGYDEKKKVTLVAHFIKRDDRVNKHREDGRVLRHVYSRKKWLDELDNKLLHNIAKKDIENVTPLTGIDAASSELGCRPEVFAPIFRKARESGIRNLTYHVGEDFYDIADGLRAIDEAIEYLAMRNGDRLGHCIAMGIDARKYYAKRHRYLIIPKQELLDNVVWLRFRSMELNVSLQPATQLFIANRMEILAEELGYVTAFSDMRYWESMKLRGKDPMNQTTPIENFSTVAEHFLDIYWYDVKSRRKGSEILSVKLPESYVEDIEKLQEGLFCKVRDRGIFIETNPTSNLRIGGFERYLDLPLFKFHTPKDGKWQLPVTINTDDKGVFATSLRNEYSLIAAAMWKARNATGDRLYSDKTIITYLKQIAEYGNLSRFR